MTSNEKNRFVKVLGISFFNCSVLECIKEVRKGGLLVVPSAPGLATLDTDIAYAQSVRAADFAIADSGFMTLCLLFAGKKTPKRISGLEFIRNLLEDPTFLSQDTVLWVLPNPEMEHSVSNLLSDRKSLLNNHRFYSAPTYKSTGAITDTALVAECETLKPDWVVLAVAGGKQEKLGLSLSQSLSFNPSIICIGAAIAFETGDQASIPNWADKMLLGWLVRIINNPKLYAPRYLAALRLAKIIVFSK